MHKDYPYLRSSYFTSTEEKSAQKKFLQQIDSFVNQKQYVKLTLLNWMEQPIKEIAGEITSGSLTKDASSPVRRTCNLQASVNGNEYNVDNAEMDFAINKKIYLEIGIKNYTKEYLEFPILWFPQGVFFISSFAMNSSTSSAVNLSISLKDKMCGLNGEVGGTFPATTILDEMDTQTATGKFVHEKVKVYDIIQELVNHFGGEDLNNIVIEDVPLRIKRVLKWTGDTPLYLVQQNGNNVQNMDTYQAQTTKPEGNRNYKTIPNTYDAGYVYDDFVYTGELTASAGESVTSILDKIVQYIGNYEYFYDEFGVFHFREKKNYMNTTQAKNLLDEMGVLNDIDPNQSANRTLDYLVSTTTEKEEFAFNDDTNLMSINATPQYGNVKNDYVIQGLHKITNSDISYPIRYHVAIDTKPQTGRTYHNVLLYEDPNTNNVIAAFPQHIHTESGAAPTLNDLPTVGNFNVIYGPISVDITNEETGETTTESQFVFWDDDLYKPVVVKKYYPDDTKDAGYTVKDWRTEIYMQGLIAKNYGLNQSIYYQEISSAGYEGKYPKWLRDIYETQHLFRVDSDFYFEELEAFWPQVYDLERQEFAGFHKPEEGSSEEQKDYVNDQNFITLCEGRYYLDFIEPSDPYLGAFAVSNIGRRSDVVVNDDINCLFQPPIPDVVFINKDDDTGDMATLREECDDAGYPYSQVSGEIFWAMATGGYRNAAYDQLKYELYLHTNYQKTISMTAIPAFYLEPGTRVTINDKSTNTYGPFVIQNVTIPLGPGSAMSVSANECFERYF